jgi:hypothetical protein
MEEALPAPELSNASSWTREEDGYIIGICKEKEMQDWRKELRAALPGRTRREILKRLWYLGVMMKKVRMVNSEGDDLGSQMRCYVSRNAVNLSDGGEDEVDEAEAIAHLEAYQRAAEDVAASGSAPAGRTGFDFDAPPPGLVGSLGGTYSGSPVQSSVSLPSDEAAESVPPSNSAEVCPTLGVIGGRWTSDEDAAIRAGFEAGRSWKEISEGLPGRTFIATKVRGGKLGLKQCEAGIPWTADEIATLRAGVEEREVEDDRGDAARAHCGGVEASGEVAGHRAQREAGPCCLDGG